MSEQIYLDDLPFNLTKEESDYLMQQIPSEISSLATQWGYGDTVFRDNLFEYIIKEKLKYSSVDEYYASDVFKNYRDNDVILSNELLFGEAQKFNIFFSVTFLDKDGTDLENNGSIGIMADNEEKARKNAFFGVVKEMFSKGYVLRRLEITKIEK